MGSAWAEPLQLCTVGRHLARCMAITGAGFELIFYQRKRLWSDFNSAGVLQKNSENRGNEARKEEDLHCSGRADT